MILISSPKAQLSFQQLTNTLALLSLHSPITTPIASVVSLSLDGPTHEVILCMLHCRDIQILLSIYLCHIVHILISTITLLVDTVLTFFISVSASLLVISR